MARSWVSGSVAWKDNDRGLKELMKRLGRRVDGISISIGVQGEQAERVDARSKETLGTIAGLNEFGAPGAKIPPRPFLGTAFEAHGGWRKELAAAVGRVVDGADGEAEIKAVGRKAVADVQHIIDTGTGRFPPNAAETIKKKGHDHPLIEDPGNPELRNAVTAALWRGKAKIG